MKSTGLPPLIICDSLISFFEDDEDENSSTDMRAIFDRCRALTRLGACVLLIHHTGKNGEVRGSSDFKGAGDQGFIVTNWDPDGGRLLHRLSLRVHKSRFGLSDNIFYNYAGGKMFREPDKRTGIKTMAEQLTAILREHPAVTKTEFEKLAARAGLPRQRIRDFLNSGVQEGSIRYQSMGRGGRYSLPCDGSRDGQENF